MSTNNTKAFETYESEVRSYCRNFPTVFVKAKGSIQTDENGKEYIDFTSGIGVCSLGYADEGWVNAITEQAGKLGHISNLFYAEPYVKAAERLCRKAGMSNVFFANSGAESNEGLIKLADGAGITATAKDIVENPKNLQIKELEAANIPNALKEVDIACINGNYAQAAGLSVEKDALAVEATDSLAAETYANVLVVKEGNEDNEAVQALVEALHSDAIRDFITEEFDGAVVPAF